VTFATECRTDAAAISSHGAARFIVASANLGS
jgi:hypothetical protein